MTLSRNQIVGIIIILLLFIGGFLIMSRSFKTTSPKQSAERPIFPTRPPSAFFDTQSTNQPATVKGVITSVTSTSVTVRNKIGQTQTFPIDPAARVALKNGTSLPLQKGLATIVVNKEATISFNNEGGTYKVAHILYLE